MLFPFCYAVFLFMLPRSVPLSSCIPYCLFYFMSLCSLCLFLSSCWLRCVISCLSCTGAQRRVCVGLLCSSCLSSSGCTCGFLPAESVTAMAMLKPCYWGSITWWEIGDCALPAFPWNSVSTVEMCYMYVLCYRKLWTVKEMESCCHSPYHLSPSLQYTMR